MATATVASPKAPAQSAMPALVVKMVLDLRYRWLMTWNRAETPRGLLFCAACGRRMQSHWINRAAYYRCRFPEEYALANKVRHPANVYLREDRIVPRLDEWLGRLFEPERLDRTLDALSAAQRAPSHEDAMQAEARRQIAECDRKLARHRAALEAGADPAVVTGWIREVQAVRAEAEAQLRRLGQPRARTLDRDELAAMTHALGDMVRVLADAAPARKAKVYAGLGLRLTYHPDKRKSWSDRHPPRI